LCASLSGITLISLGNISGTSSTPAGADLFIDDETSLLPFSDQKEMHTTVAKLLFLSTRVRPDILLSVNYLTTKVNKFTPNDKRKLTRILKYLNKTKSLGLTLQSTSTSNIKILNHSDASYGVQHMAFTVMGVVSLPQRHPLGRDPSSLHRTSRNSTKSSTEAEIVCAAYSVGNILGFRNYLVHETSTWNLSISDKIIHQQSKRWQMEPNQQRD
jgi:hypothetical protein